MHKLFVDNSLRFKDTQAGKENSGADISKSYQGGSEKMKKILTELLETFGYPVFLQGSLSAEEDYPDSFFTFWNFDTPEEAFYDNDANQALWGFWVYFYSVDPRLVEIMPERARKSLKENGFILHGKAHDIAVDKPTHTGAFITVYKFENYESEE